MNLTDIGNLLKRYLTAAPQRTEPEVSRRFDEVSQTAPHDAVSDGLTEAFRSPQTPPFDQMVARLFGQSSPPQQAGLLNQLIAALASSGALSRLGESGVLESLARLLSSGQREVTPQQAAQVPPDVVQRLANEAEKENPSVVDRIGGFYAEHPELVKTLGGAALTIIMAKMAERLKTMP